ncbi:hypothetical protein MRB53_014026 [Persea americana]|uniref:Uncharacterized protein n=1 Tax=Persea americana TaxID=3435 RepID=A0ACC2K9R8_PERAE|nr:hypothetical protein MRB53_014026 [Persea americana]
MGVYRYLLEGEQVVAAFRAQYNIPADVKVRLDNPEDPTDGLIFHNGWMSFWLVTVVEGGVRVLGISLGVSDIEDVYDLCKSVDRNSYYLRIRSSRAGFVTVLEDSYQYAGDDRIFVKRECEFSESETRRSLWILRSLGTPPSKGRDLFGFPSSSVFIPAGLTSLFAAWIFAREDRQPRDTTR